MGCIVENDHTKRGSRLGNIK